MNFRRVQWIFLGFILIGIYSCLSETESPTDGEYGYEYYPLEVGRTWTYQSDSIIITKAGRAKDTLTSFIRQEITDSLRSEEGHLLYRVDRWIKKQGQDDWQKMNAWFVEKDATKVICTEDNIPLVKMVFPLKAGTRFSSNLYFDDAIKSEVGGEFVAVYSGWRPQVVRLNAEVDYQNEVFEAAEIKMADIESVIDLRRVTAYYVKGIGLLRQEMIVYDSDADNPDRPWDDKAKKGFKHTLQLIDYQ